MIEINRSDRKYVEIFTYYVGSMGASAEERCLLEGQTLNAGKSLTLRVGTRRRNIFQEERAGFKATTDVNKKKSAKR
jgi:hypothetical protein